MAPSDPSDTVLAVCLRVRQSGALRVFVALGRIILDLWAAPPQFGFLIRINSIISSENFPKKNSLEILGSLFHFGSRVKFCKTRIFNFRISSCCSRNS